MEKLRLNINEEACRYIGKALTGFAAKFKMAEKCRLLHHAAKRYLVSKATNRKIGKFSVQRTLEHLQRCNVVLNQDVKQMKINLLQPIDQFNNGAHRFFWENFPQLKYKNPQVKFCRSERKAKAEDLLVEFGDGRMETISTRQKSPSQIMQEVINIATLPDPRPDNLADDDSITRETETS